MACEMLKRAVLRCENNIATLGETMIRYAM